MKKYKIVNKTRFVTFLLAFTLLIIYIGGNLKSFAQHKIQQVSNKNFSSYSKYRKIVAKKGDSLWNISSEILPEGEDIRNIVYDLKVLNDIEDGMIKEGDIIKIPNLE